MPVALDQVEETADAVGTCFSLRRLGTTILFADGFTFPRNPTSNIPRSEVVGKELVDARGLAGAARLVLC